MRATKPPGSGSRCGALLGLGSGVLFVFACGPSSQPWDKPGDMPPPSAMGGGNYNGGALGSEICSNGLDDDHDRDIDEDCACTGGSTQACWPGDLEDRGMGACRDGVQTCTGQGEFSAWGECEGATLPSADTSVDGVDQDCNGEDGPTATCASYESVCQGGADEDCDGKIDCADPDCAHTAACTLATCTGQCIPGYARWCDTDADCSWGRQTCTPSGTWGTCIETGPPPGCGTDWDTEYDTDCCDFLADACCQNYPANNSIGECGGNGTCP